MQALISHVMSCLSETFPGHPRMKDEARKVEEAFAGFDKTMLRSTAVAAGYYTWYESGPQYIFGPRYLYSTSSVR